jgi:hypothetical protein
VTITPDAVHALLVLWAAWVALSAAEILVTARKVKR